MKLRCLNCGAEFNHKKPIWRCDCGGLLELEYKPEYIVENFQSRPFNMWRYREAIPVVDDTCIVSFNEGGTPLYQTDFSGVDVYMKMDYLFPSGSFKDRGASVMISKAKEQGVKHIVEDSSGNAGSAIAMYSTNAGIRCDIYVPSYASMGKLVQIQAFGAVLHKIKGSREDTTQAALEAAERTYYGSHVWSPFFNHGVKTVIYEIIEQLGWKVPDVIVMPVGHGSNLIGSYMGLCEMQELGIIDGFPRLIGVQSESCAPVTEAYRKGLSHYIEIEKKDTIAEGIAVAHPLRSARILEAVRETDGKMITVSENEIKHALKTAFKKGLYIEPTSASAIAGLGKIKTEGLIVCTLTGHGLKATDKINSLL